LKTDDLEPTDLTDPADRTRRRRLRRGMYIVPSLFTSGNIAAGYYAITQSLQGSVQEPRHFNWAALAIGFAIPFDALDGRIARMTKTTSEFGKELDSLADVITFGVAPSLLAYTWGFQALPVAMDAVRRQHVMEWGAFVCFLFLLCGAGRLARFNIGTHITPTNPGRPDRKYFVGMPIPAAAGVIAAVVHFFSGTPVPNWRIAIMWMALVLVVGLLMVSTWRFWSGKEINLADRHPFRLIVLMGLAIYGTVFFSQYVLLAVAFVYMFSGIFARAAVSNGQNPRQVPGILTRSDINVGANGFDNFPYFSDSNHPSVFWITNGENDFEYNQASGAGTCGACYWFVPAAISGTSQGEHWFRYAGEQVTAARAGITPLQEFFGNSCSSAMNGF